MSARARFALWLTTAQIGGNLAFAPLLAILLPLKVEAIAPLTKAQTLAEIAVWGALTASVANIAAGWGSDLTDTRFGRRRPWLVVGAIGTALSYILFARATSIPALILSIMVFQTVLSVLLGPLAAILADRVPVDERGRVAGVLSLGNPLGAGIGAAIVGWGALHGDTRLMVIAATMLALTLPFGLAYRDAPLAQVAPVPIAVRRRLGDFALAWVARLLAVGAIALALTYMLFHLQTLGPAPGGISAAAGLARLTALGAGAHIVAGLSAGWLSDRIGRRKPVAVAAALAVAAAALIFARAPGWDGAMLGFVVLGLGHGAFQAVDGAMMTQVLPAARRAGRDLGVVNLTNTLPQFGAPLLALALIGMGGGYRPVFLAAAVMAVLAALLFVPIRVVR